MMLVPFEEIVVPEHGGRVALGSKHQLAKFGFVEPEVEDGVVEFAGPRQGPEGVGDLGRRRHRLRWPSDREVGDAAGAVDFHGDRGILDPVFTDGPIEWRERHADGVVRAIGALGHRMGAGEDPLVPR